MDLTLRNAQEIIAKLAEDVKRFDYPNNPAVVVSATVVDTDVAVCLVLKGDKNREYVRWFFRPAEGFFWGHYFNSFDPAYEDYLNTVNREVLRWIIV